MRQIAAQLALEEIDLRARELIQRLEVVVGRDARVRDDQDAVLHVIEREHRIEDHEPGFVPQGRIRLPVGLQRHRLEPRGRVVAEVADGASGESRQLGNERRAEIRHHPAQHVDELLGLLRRHAGSFDDGLAVARAKHDERILAEERVPADVLAALDALEQERIVGVLGDAQERRHRRQQIGDELLDDRHEGASLRELGECLERCLFHNGPHRALPAASILPAAAVPSHHSDWSSACATSMSSPPMRLAAGGRRFFQQPGLHRVVDEVVDDAGRRTRPRTASRRRSETSRPESCSPAGPSSPAPPETRQPSPPASAATSFAFPRFLPYTVTTLPADASATATARAAPPVPRIAARAPRRFDAALRAARESR